VGAEALRHKIWQRFLWIQDQNHNKSKNRQRELHQKQKPLCIKGYNLE
jgi:hypothetical protein